MGNNNNPNFILPETGTAKERQQNEKSYVKKKKKKKNDRQGMLTNKFQFKDLERE